MAGLPVECDIEHLPVIDRIHASHIGDAHEAHPGCLPTAKQLAIKPTASAGNGGELFASGSARQATVIQFWGSSVAPFTYTWKCRWQPVDSPVVPT